MFNRIFVAATLILLIGCQTTSSPEATKPTWDRGYLHARNIAGNKFCGYYLVDHEYTDKCQENFSKAVKNTGKRFPVIVFLHGCLKVMGEHSLWLADLGYIVVSPDSFQREGRAGICFGSKPHILAMRDAEITYAREQLKKMDWVDQSRVFLAGVSEGGRAVADHSGKDFRAKIVMAYGCHADPISGSLPVLNLVGDLDRVSKGENMLCSVSGRPNSEAVNLPERAHLFLEDELASEKIKTFLGQFK